MEKKIVRKILSENLSFNNVSYGEKHDTDIFTGLARLFGYAIPLVT
jgi:hypothetical protein